MDKDLISQVTKELSSYFSDTKEDRPDSILSSYPNSVKVIKSLELLLDAVFPGRNPENNIDSTGLESYLNETISKASKLLLPEIELSIPLRWSASANLRQADKKEVESVSSCASQLLSDLLKELPKIRQFIISDIQAAYDGDPAAHSYAEVKMAFPGVLAIACHRISHKLYQLNLPVIPRIMSEWTHSQTGCDIHPGAQIGQSFFVDHPTGVVIGETAVIGNNVKLYQGVTLGAKSFPLDENGKPIKHIRRHPTVEDDVVIYSNATILGGKTIIGKGTTVGGNVFLVESVAAGSLVTANSSQPRVREAKL